MTEIVRPENVPEDWVLLECANPDCEYMVWGPDIPDTLIVHSSECALNMVKAMEIQTTIETLTCMPVDRSELRVLAEGSPELTALLNRIPNYDGAIKGNCMSCKCEVWIGPKQQAHLKFRPESEVLCFFCALADFRQHSGSTHVFNLGNDQVPND